MTGAEKCVSGVNSFCSVVADRSRSQRVQALCSQCVPALRGKFALQIDESTDASGLCQLIANVRYVEDKFTDNFLFCKELDIHATGDEIFSVTD